MLLKAIEPICSDDTAVTLMDRLAILGAVTMVKALKLMIKGALIREPQEHAQATYAPKMQKTDGLIDWTLPAAIIERRIRAYDPWPGSFTFLPARLNKPGLSGRIKVLQAEVMRQQDEAVAGAEPGAVCLISPIGPVIATGDFPICLTAVQPDGSRRMDGKSFLNGHPMQPGDRFCASADQSAQPE
jgi:methionyl-tRNA formyltransferase